MAADTGAPGILREGLSSDLSDASRALKPRPWPPIPNAPIIGCIERHLNSLRCVRPLRPGGGPVEEEFLLLGNFPRNSREISRKFPGNSWKSDYAVILFVRAFPGNFPETFFDFPEKKTVCHRNILDCVTGIFEKPPGGRYKSFREYWPQGTS